MRNLADSRQALAPGASYAKMCILPLMRGEIAEMEAGLPPNGKPLQEQPDISFEAELARLDERLGATQKVLTDAQRQLRQAVEASRQGNLRDLPRLLNSVVEATGKFAQTALDTQRSWAFDGLRHLEEGGYVAELATTAQAAGLDGLREVDGQLYCFPVTIKVDVRDYSLKVGKKTQRGLRPSVIVALLKRLRSQPARDNLRPLLATFEKAYLTLTRDQDGIAIPLRRLYNLLVLRPGQGREYTEVDFMLDVYRLDRAGAQLTPGGRELSFPASTGIKGGRGIRFVTERGEERYYSSIRLDSEGK
jgi:hypothetical protein